MEANPVFEPNPVLRAPWRAVWTVGLSAFRWVGCHARPIAGALAMLALMLGIAFLPIDYAVLGDYGYLGIFGITLVSSASLALPVPYLAAVIAAGSYLDPGLVALVAGSAGALGELTGFVAGRSGRGLLPDHQALRWVEGKMNRFGAPVIFLAALVPNPFFDAVGLIAGAARLHVLIFLAACFSGKALRFWALAALGGVLIPGGG